MPLAGHLEPHSHLGVPKHSKTSPGVSCHRHEFREQRARRPKPPPGRHQRYPVPGHPSECGQRNGCPKAKPSAQSRPPRVCPEAHPPTPAPRFQKLRRKDRALQRTGGLTPPKAEGRADAFALKTILQIQQENLSRAQPLEPPLSKAHAALET